MQILLTEEELIRENNLFAPNNNSYRKLGGTRLDLGSFVEQEKKAAEALKSGETQKGDTPAVYVPPTC